MAIKAEIKTSFGEKRQCYIRLNNIEANNHGAPATALFRAYLSSKAFREGASFVAEFPVEFKPDVNEKLWPQAYAALVEQEGFDKGDSDE